jgi:hypothetical protein
MLSETRTIVPAGPAGTVVDVVVVDDGSAVVVEGDGASVVVVGNASVVVVDAGAEVVVVEAGGRGGDGGTAHPATSTTTAAPSAPIVPLPMRRRPVRTMCPAPSLLDCPRDGQACADRRRVGGRVALLVCPP